jgi:hypothetical protein
LREENLKSFLGKITPAVAFKACYTRLSSENNPSIINGRYPEGRNRRAIPAQLKFYSTPNGGSAGKHD